MVQRWKRELTHFNSNRPVLEVAPETAEEDEADKDEEDEDDVAEDDVNNCWADFEDDGFEIRPEVGAGSDGKEDPEDLTEGASKVEADREGTAAKGAGADRDEARIEADDGGVRTIL